MSLSYLNTPVASVIDPPIDTTCQELPLEKLSWEDFEKLCLAVIQTEFSINDCEIYGIKGQAQQGIDIYARQSDGRYSSYQCKRYQDFDVVDLDKAVTYFKTKKFYTLSDKLYLCTSCEWNKTQLQDKFESLRTELEKESIILVKWDKIQLSRILKLLPQVVYDYFGEAWVKKFNGDDGMEKLSKSKVLDAGKIVRYRKELYEFYSTIFNLHDPGIPIKELNIPYTIQDRFIIPDIISILKEENFDVSEEKKESAAKMASFYDREQLYHADYWDEENEGDLRLKRKEFNEEDEDSSIDLRLNIDDALIENNKNIIIGDPGAGKSTLLRYIVLDILSPKPKLENISQKYGKLLPVWLPFAFITKHLSVDDSLSISEVLRLWFNGLGKKHLFELAERALEDERLFFIIDGIDEWNNISSAQQAIRRIETIRSLYNCQVLYSSRPYGFKILKDYFTNLKVLNLAGFSNQQQTAFADNWYSKWISTQKDPNDQEFSKTQSRNFIKELGQTSDLKKLAEIPLLLSILIIQKIRDAVLPKNKLEALKEMTQYLINKHPAKRVSDAGIVADNVNDIDFKDIFCELAIYIQKASNDGVILKIEAHKIIEEYLSNYAGYSIAKAKLRSRELIDVGANSFGIIVEKSNDEISFSHKQFQEFLAAQHLFESDEDLANDFIDKFAASPTSHQVIVSFFALIPLKQVIKYRKYFEVLKGACHEHFQKNYLKLLSYEVAINVDNAPTDTSNTAFDAITAEFENETELLYKEALLKRILAALHNSKLTEKVQKFVLRYVPNSYRYTDYRIGPLRFVGKLNAAQFTFVKNVFINGKSDLRYAASNVIKKHIKDARIHEFVKDIFLNCPDPEALAFAINSVTASGLEESEVEELLASVTIKNPKVEFFKYKHKVAVKKHDENDLENIMAAAEEMPYELEQEVINILAEGFGANYKLKKNLVQATNTENRYSQRYITDDKIAWKVLFHSYSKDPEIIELVRKEFEDKDHPFTGIRHDLFQHLVYYFKDNEILKSAVEIWLERRLEEFHTVDNDVAFACIFLGSERAKEILLDDLPVSGISHWPVMALLEGWPEDLEVRDALKDYFRTQDHKNTGAAAGYVSRIFKDDKAEGIAILEEILFNRSLYWRERSIPALIELDKDYFENNILEKLLEILETFPKDIFNQYYTAVEDILKNYSTNPIVEKYMFKCLENDSSIYPYLIEYYPEKDIKDDRELNCSLPLPKEFRLLIIEKLSELNFLPPAVQKTFLDFNKEESDEIKGDIAMCLFSHLRLTDSDKIVELCKPLVFGVGFDHQMQRNIAFTGFLMAKKLEQYFLLEDPRGDGKKIKKALPADLFSNYEYRRSASGLMIKNIIDNFNYFISYVGRDFEILTENVSFKRSAEDMWGFFARHSVRSSPSYSFLMEFISANSKTIQNSSIISFLNRTSPRSPILKAILLRIIKSPESKNKALAGKLLGVNFKGDPQVYEEVSKVTNTLDIGRILALCNGWAEDKILIDIFDDIVENHSHVDNHVGYNLKFLFRDVNNLSEFLKNVLTDIKDSKGLHQYFFVPMIERIKRDPALCAAIKTALFTSETVTEKISYYNLLSQVNMIDDEVRSWKNQIKEFHNDSGYDIVSNRETTLKNVLYDYYYHLN